MDKYVITIGREYGSAGRQIGMQLADELGIKCYDKELLARAAKDSGMAEELFHNHDEKPTNSFLYSLVMDTYSMGYSTSSFVDMPLNQKVFMAQYDSIKKLAQEENCIIVGRCADYALKDDPAIIISIPTRNGQTQEVMIYVSTAVNSALTILSNFLNHILKQDFHHQKELYNRI